MTSAKEFRHKASDVLFELEELMKKTKHTQTLLSDIMQEDVLYSLSTESLERGSRECERMRAYCELTDHSLKMCSTMLRHYHPRFQDPAPPERGVTPGFRGKEPFQVVM